MYTIASLGTSTTAPRANGAAISDQLHAAARRRTNATGAKKAIPNNAPGSLRLREIESISERGIVVYSGNRPVLYTSSENPIAYIESVVSIPAK